MWDASCKIWLIWAGKIKTTPNIMKITSNLPQLDLIIVTWKRERDSGPSPKAFYSQLHVQRLAGSWISYIPTPNVYLTRMKICSLMAPPLSWPTWVIMRIILSCRKRKFNVLENCQANYLIPYYYYYYYYFGRLRYHLPWY